MDEILVFRNFTFYPNTSPEKITIRGNAYEALADLCFSHADRFSLIRNGWPGAWDGRLEQELRPYCIGNYDSYGILCCFDERVREKCYLYQATEETKAILLRHIHHLFDREASSAPEGHAAYFDRKYAAYYRACEEAGDRFEELMDNDPNSSEQIDAFMKEAYREAEEIWQQIFDPKDYYSTMEDPCFFRGDEMFLETITHEGECFAHCFSDSFGAELRKLGKWMVSENIHPPLFTLQDAEGLHLYTN